MYCSITEELVAFHNSTNSLYSQYCTVSFLFDRVEDHDDLTPIFNRQSDMLKMTYGDYFLAELIEAQDDHMHCLVAEVGSFQLLSSIYKKDICMVLAYFVLGDF